MPSATDNTLKQAIHNYIASERLPDHYGELIETYWLPLAAKIAGMEREKPLLIGINGAQGTGKSTMAGALKLILEQQFGLRTALLALDDFYLTRSQRKSLAEHVSPLLMTRGVPGTHDTALLISVIDQLTASDSSSVVEVPRFNKATDERLPEKDWYQQRGVVDVILFEGWCVGTHSQAVSQLENPVNLLEESEDAAGIWRSYVNESLEKRYAPIFNRLDLLLMLKAPDFETVYAWRGEQEEKLKASAGGGAGVMDAAALARFIHHYERLTRHTLATLPDKADALFCFDQSHRIADHRYRGALA